VGSSEDIGPKEHRHGFARIERIRKEKEEVSVLIRVIRGEVLSDLSRLNADRSIEQILPPLVVGSSHQAHDVAAGVEIEGAGLAHKLHSGFIGHLVALAAIAGMAACHQIFPGGSASARTGHDVVEREFS